MVSPLVGGGAYWFGLHQISQQVISLAKSESARVAPGILSRVNGTAEAISVLQSMAQDYLKQGFVVVELNNRQGRMVADATAIGDRVFSGADHHALALPVHRLAEPQGPR